MTSAEQLTVIYTGRAGEGIVFSPDASGWARYTEAASQESQAMVFLNFALADAAALVRAVHLEKPLGSVTSDALRSVPLGRIVAAVNRPRHLEAVRPLLPELHAPIDPMSDEMTDEGWAWWMYAPARPRPVKLKLKIPTDYRKPDAFYAQVADRFAYLASLSDRPAYDLAEANGVPVTTVHGWVKEARKRGLLAGGERARKGPVA